MEKVTCASYEKNPRPGSAERDARTDRRGKRGRGDTGKAALLPMRRGTIGIVTAMPAEFAPLEMTNAKCFMSGGVLGWAVGAAQVRPIDIGAQIFTAHSAIRCALNGRTVFSGEPSRAVAPKAHRLDGDFKRLGEPCSAANNGKGVVE